MKAQEIIDEVTQIRPSEIDPDIMLGWLSALDARVYDDFISWHEDAPERPETYSEPSSELLIPDPYAHDVYFYYLASRIDELTDEMVRMNNELTGFSDAYSSYQAYYNRNHLPRQDNYITGVALEGEPYDESDPATGI